MTNPSNENRENACEDTVQYPPSPVPGDADLAEGELPFTAFGQFGEGAIDLRVFEQDKYWVDVHGTPFLIEEMKQDYLFNVLAFLYNHAEYYYVAMVNRVAVEILFMEKKPAPDAPVFNLVRSLIEGAPTAWMNNTPLVRKLNDLLDK